MKTIETNSLMEKLFAILEKIYPLSDACKVFLLQRVQCSVIKKKEFILKAGHVCRGLYYVESGLFRCFYEVNEKSVSSWFTKEEEFIISIKSFFGQLPSQESIHALQDSVVYYIRYEDLQEIYAQYPEFNLHIRVLLEMYLRQSEDRLSAMRATSAIERYRFLMENHAEFLLRIPSKYLASYIGMSPYTYSRIRKAV